MVDKRNFLIYALNRCIRKMKANNKGSPRFASIITPHAGDSDASQMAQAGAFFLRKAY